MGLRLLAGPFPVRSRKGEAATGVQINTYYPRVGLIGNIHGGISSRGIFTLDGVFEPIHKFGGSGHYGWWPDRGRLLGGGAAKEPASGYTGEYEIEPKLLLGNFVTDYWGVPLFFRNPDSYVRLKDRRVFLDGVRVISLIGTETAIEADMPSTAWPWENPQCIGPGRSPTDLFIAYNSRRPTLDDPPLAVGVFYDSLTKTFGTPMYTGVSGHLWYAPEHGVLINVTAAAPWQMRIFSLEVEPSVISEPVVIRGQSKAGHVATYQVRVTGKHNDPCPDELLDWTILGSGRLEHPQSSTDKDGYATMKVIYGLDDTGDTTVKVSLRC